jgi:transcriptional regulator with XRE-family HTH domain
MRKDKGLTQVRLAKMVGVSTSTISKWETGEQGLTAENANSVAEALGVSVDKLLGRGSGLVHSRMPRAALVPVMGELQAGVWREALEIPPDDRESVPFFIPPEYRDYQLAAYVVRGNSMNQVFRSGSYVLVASTIANGLRPRNGQNVLVSRRNRDGLHEATIKEYVVAPDGTEWLWPRSTAPEYQAPIRVADPDTEEVVITGVVIMAQIMVV